MNTARDTSSVMMTSEDISLVELYVDDGFNLASRNRACTVRSLGHTWDVGYWADASSYTTLQLLPAVIALTPPGSTRKGTSMCAGKA